VTLKEPSSFKRGWMPIWLHVTISMALMAIAFVSVFMLPVIVLHRFALFSLSSRVSAAIYLVLAVVATITPQVLMYKLVPAKCSSCGGRCWAPFPRRKNTLKYICEHCGRVVDTRLRGEFDAS